MESVGRIRPHTSHDHAGPFPDFVQVRVTKVHYLIRGQEIGRIAYAQAYLQLKELERVQEAAS